VGGTAETQTRRGLSGLAGAANVQPACWDLCACFAICFFFKLVQIGRWAALLHQFLYALRLSAGIPAAHSILHLSMSETRTLHEFSLYEGFGEVLLVKSATPFTSMGTFRKFENLEDLLSTCSCSFRVLPVTAEQCFRSDWMAAIQQIRNGIPSND
jgi:hypothetical protein